MTATCEVCGSPVRTTFSRVEIDGAVLRVCPRCAKRGNPLSPAPQVAPHRMQPPVLRGAKGEEDLEVDPDYDSIVKSARESLGLTQEALGRAINVKPSVISHIETRKLKPDLGLARVLMHYLKVRLLVPSSELESTASKANR